MRFDFIYFIHIAYVVMLTISLTECLFIWKKGLKKRFLVVSIFVFAIGFCLTCINRYALSKLINIALLQMICLVIYAFLIIALCFFIYKLNKNRVAPDAIIEAFDCFQTGLCYYKDSGRVILCNESMHQNSRMLFGSDVLNGNSFFDQIADISDGLWDPTDYDFTNGLNRVLDFDRDAFVVRLEDSKMIMFQKRQIRTDASILTELSAIDITEFYQAAEQLKAANKDQARLNAYIKNYGALADQLIREQEILDAKISIHDNFSNMLISTRNALEHPEDKDRLHELVEEWKLTLELLSDHNYKEDMDRLSELKETAEAVGVEIHMSSDLPEGNREKQAMTLAIRECLTNTVRHADGHHLYVDVHEVPGLYVIVIRNDGHQPTGPVTEGGGLSMVRNKVEALGGSMKVDWIEGFKLSITIPRT